MSGKDFTYREGGESPPPPFWCHTILLKKKVVYTFTGYKRLFGNDACLHRSSLKAFWIEGGHTDTPSSNKLYLVRRRIVPDTAFAADPFWG